MNIHTQNLQEIKKLKNNIYVITKNIYNEIINKFDAIFQHYQQQLGQVVIIDDVEKQTINDLIPLKYTYTLQKDIFSFKIVPQSNNPIELDIIQASWHGILEKVNKQIADYYKSKLHIDLYENLSLKNETDNREYITNIPRYYFYATHADDFFRQALTNAFKKKYNLNNIKY